MGNFNFRNTGRHIGRALLWFTLLLLLFTGLRTILGGQAESAQVVSNEDRVVFPDQQGAEAFAVNFATRYLTYSSGRQDLFDDALEGLHSFEESGVGFSVPDDGHSQEVTHVIPSRFTALDRSRSRVIVSADVVVTSVKRNKKTGKSTTRVVSDTLQFWTIHVARDGAGGFSVYQYPSRVAGPPPATVEVQNMEQPETAELSEFELLLTYFFPAYFSGDEGEFAAYITNRTRLEPVPADQFQFLAIEEILQPENSQGPRREITVEIRVANPGNEENPVGTRTMTYDVELLRAADNRWLVSAVNPE